MSLYPSDVLHYMSIVCGIVIECKRIDNPDHGTFVITNGTAVYQDKATFVCDAGYAIVGETTVMCEASGNWSGSATCTIKGIY